MQTGQIISELRKKFGFTQEALASKLFVSQQLVSKWEDGLRRPDFHMVEKMAEIFSVDVSYILDSEDMLAEELSECMPENKNVSSMELPVLLDKFLPTISDKQRFIFLRRYYFWDAPKEIGEKVGMNTNQVRTTLSRVRKKLSKYLTEVLK